MVSLRTKSRTLKILPGLPHVSCHCSQVLRVCLVGTILMLMGPLLTIVTDPTCAGMVDVRDYSVIGACSICPIFVPPGFSYYMLYHVHHVKGP